MKLACLTTVCCTALGACSLFGVGDVHLVACDGDPTVCAKLNAGLFADTCQQYACHKSGFGCELRPRDADRDGQPDRTFCAAEFPPATLDCDDHDGEVSSGHAESPDGKDNDCDGFIDESTAPSASAAATIAVGPNTGYLSQSSTRDGMLYIALTQAERTADTFSTRGLVWDGKAFAEFSPLAGANASWRCKYAAHADAGCNFAQVAISAGDEALFALGVNRSGCGSGQVRVGLGEAADFTLELGVQVAASNLRFGVDIDDTGCTRSGPCPGASAPVLAALASTSSGPQQGLAVWNAPFVDEPCESASDCPACSVATQRRVVGLGLWLQHSRDAPQPWLLGTNAGRSEPFEFPAAVDDPPALTGWRDAEGAGGYLLAYASVAAVQLTYVPLLSAADVDHVSLLDGARANSVPAIRPRRVALATDAAHSGTSGASAVWSSASAEGDVINLCAVELDGTQTPSCRAQRALVRDSHNPIVAGPVIAYGAAGFAAGDAQSARGGWFVAWLEATGPTDASPRRLMGTRVAERELRQLDATFELARGEITHLFSHAQDDPALACHIAYGYVLGSRLFIAPNLCPARPN